MTFQARKKNKYVTEELFLLGVWVCTSLSQKKTKQNKTHIQNYVNKHKMITVKSSTINLNVGELSPHHRPARSTVHGSLNNWKSTLKLVTRVDTHTLQGKSPPVHPKSSEVLTLPQTLTRLQFMCSSYRHASIGISDGSENNNLVHPCFDQSELQLGLIAEWIHRSNFLSKMHQSRWLSVRSGDTWDQSNHTIENWSICKQMQQGDKSQNVCLISITIIANESRCR